MSITDMHESDRSLRLLAGDSYHFENFDIKQKTLKEVKDVGYSKYNQYLGILTFKVEDLIDVSKVESPEEISVFEVLLFSGNEELIDMFLDALCFFLNEHKDSIKFHKELGIVFGKLEDEVSTCKLVNRTNYSQLVDVIKFQNYIASQTQKDFNPKDDKAKSIISRLKRANEIVMRKKSAEGEEVKIDFADIVSAVSTKSNTYNKHTVWGLTMYQFYDEYKRLERITSYESSILAMVQGAKIDLKTWYGKLD